MSLVYLPNKYYKQAAVQANSPDIAVESSRKVSRFTQFVKLAKVPDILVSPAFIYRKVTNLDKSGLEPEIAALETLLPCAAIRAETRGIDKTCDKAAAARATEQNNRTKNQDGRKEQKKQKQ